MAAISDILKISFEFSSKLGVRELPQLKPDHQSTVPGLYVVGDLADAPIIKVALNQGYEVAQRVAQQLAGKAANDDVLDVVVIGAGPAGIGAALALNEAGCNYKVIEKEQPFNTIQNFPKAKLIFSEPKSIESKGNIWFEDAQKEELVDRWSQALDQNALPIDQPVEVKHITRDAEYFSVATERPAEGGQGEKQVYRCRRVILAIGRRGTVRKLNVPGENLEKVAYALRDPAEFAGKQLLVVGGGDSAVEAALSCAEAGAKVTISYRGDAFVRAKARNREKIEQAIARGEVTAALGTQPTAIADDAVTLKGAAGEQQIVNDQVLVFIGTQLPHGFLKRIGVRMAGQMDWLRATWVTSFAALTYLFYVLKTKRDLYPFGPSDPLAAVPDLLKVDLGFRTVGPSFWGTLVYALLILGFGIRAYRKYPSRTQKRRYLSLIGFQWIFLFGIPELIAPAIISIGNTIPELWSRAWKFYSFSVPWPLSIWSMIDGPNWGVSAAVAGTWVAFGAIVAFVLVPLYVRSQGERFCSYMCGCGGLAETLGDLWRHLAPRGATAYKAEWFGRVILLLAVPVTLLILNDAWGFFAQGALYSTKEFAQHWYGLMVDFWLASVLGVAFYPYWGNRVWCRFFCPLRAWMELIAKRFARITIKANDKCIGCGECTRFCQMGINVQRFAQQQRDMDNSNSACIQCGICIQVCPMEVLSIGERQFASEKRASLISPATGV